MNYRNVTIKLAATLDTQGHILRVCGTLLNQGVITDTVSGGEGGLGGAAGWGANPLQDEVPEGCPPREVECTNGQPGLPGEEGAVPQAGAGGHGGGGGGGGGGAWWIGDEYSKDADGGDGAPGRAGGKGGGYVQIYALALELWNEGVIHADGQDGANGWAAPSSYDDCGAQYTGVFGEGLPGDPYKDLAGGGGGGGAGGHGGGGGTVEIYCAYLSLLGTVHAAGGTGGDGGDGALSGTSQAGHCLIYGAEGGQHGPGCPGGNGGGHGGCGAHEGGDCAIDGQAGATGSPGAPGTVIVTEGFADCNENGIPDECDIAGGFYDLTHLGVPVGYEGYGVFAYAVNNSGQVVGTLQVEDTLPEIAHAFVWDGGEMTLLPVLPDSPNGVAIAYDINDAGMVVGCADAPPQPSLGHNWHAVRWERIDGEWTIFDLCEGYLFCDYCQARAINEQGQTVGWCGEEDEEQAFLWLPEPACGLDVGMNSLHAVHSDAQESKAFAINDYGDVAGWAHCVIYIWPEGELHWLETWIWRCDEPEDTVFVHDYSVPNGLSNSMEVIICGFGTGLCVPEWECYGLPGLGGGGRCPLGINDGRQAVGWATTADDEQRACRWDWPGDAPDEAVVVDLNYVSPVGSDWVLREATDISETGCIVGHGVHDGLTRAFILAPIQSPDCNTNGVPDECELACNDCNGNGILDECDIACGTSLDVDPPNGCPDDNCDWEDCNLNGIADWYDIYIGTSCDVNESCIPDECEGLGDLNCDEALNFFDIDAFVLALIDPDGYAEEYPDCDAMRADCNCDLSVDFFDVDCFVFLITQCAHE